MMSDLPSLPHLPSVSPRDSPSVANQTDASDDSRAHNKRKMKQQAEEDKYQTEAAEDNEEEDADAAASSSLLPAKRERKPSRIVREQQQPLADPSISSHAFNDSSAGGNNRRPYKRRSAAHSSAAPASALAASSSSSAAAASSSSSRAPNKPHRRLSSAASSAPSRHVPTSFPYILIAYHEVDKMKSSYHLVLVAQIQTEEYEVKTTHSTNKHTYTQRTKSHQIPVNFSFINSFLFYILFFIFLFVRCFPLLLASRFTSRSRCSLQLSSPILLGASVEAHLIQGVFGLSVGAWERVRHAGPESEEEKCDDDE